MDFPKHIDRITTGLSPFCILRGHRSKFLNNDVFLSLKIVFILANKAHPEKNDEILPDVAFHLGKKDNKDQVMIQSSTTPDPGYHMGK